MKLEGLTIRIWYIVVFICFTDSLEKICYVWVVYNVDCIAKNNLSTQNISLKKIKQTVF